MEPTELQWHVLAQEPQDQGWREVASLYAHTRCRERARAPLTLTRFKTVSETTTLTLTQALIACLLYSYSPGLDTHTQTIPVV